MNVNYVITVVQSGHSIPAAIFPLHSITEYDLCPDPQVALSFISTEGALRRPITYPSIHPIHPVRQKASE